MKPMLYLSQIFWLIYLSLLASDRRRMIQYKRKPPAVLLNGWVCDREIQTIIDAQC